MTDEIEEARKTFYETWDAFDAAYKANAFANALTFPERINSVVPWSVTQDVSDAWRRYEDLTFKALGIRKGQERLRGAWSQSARHAHNQNTKGTP